MSITPSARTARKRFYPIYLDSLRVDSVLDFDLYIEQGFDYVLYRSARLPFTEKTRQTLLENNTSRLFVSTQSQHLYQKYLEANLSVLVRDSSIQESVRAGMVYESAKFLVQDLFARPTLGENVKRSQELVDSTVGFILTKRTAFASLLNVLSFDYSTYTHSVNVCTLSLALAQFTGMRDPEELQTLGTGALLHDIGKTKVSDTILNKVEPLTAAEMDLIKKHPEWGYDLAKETDLLKPDSYYPIVQHHERENCTGYPGNMCGPKIHLYGKIAAIADVFDAMTTEKVYRSAIETFPALKTMFADEGAFDRTLLEKFAKMLGPSHTADG